MSSWLRGEPRLRAPVIYGAQGDGERGAGRAPVMGYVDPPSPPPPSKILYPPPTPAQRAR